LTQINQVAFAVPTRDRINLLGIDIDNVTFHETLIKIESLIENRKPSFIVTTNVDHLITLQEDSDFRKIYKRAALAVPDGVPLLWAARFLGKPLRERVAGSDLFPALCQLAAQKGYGLFFLGGRSDVADKAKSTLERRCPGIKIVDTYSPSFGFETDPGEIEKICSLIKRARPDILFVGLGAPKQERFIFQYKDALNIPFSMGIGISFDFFAGTTKRAPIWMQKIGLEWFSRVLTEPRRLFKRYLIRDMRFFKLIYLQKKRMGCQMPSQGS
jgi:exopolysaccharide biosynthesis WecB/TagA/CpsF family protein